MSYELYVVSTTKHETRDFPKQRNIFSSTMWCFTSSITVVRDGEQLVKLIKDSAKRQPYLRLKQLKAEPRLRALT